MVSLQSERLDASNDHRDMRDELAVQEVAALNDPAYSDIARERLRRELAPVIRVSAEGTAKRLGLDNEHDIQRIEAALFEAELSLTRSRVELAEGRSLPTSLVATTSTNDARMQREAHWTFKKLSEDALRQHPKGGSWEHKVKVAAALFDDYSGSAPIYKIDKRMVRNFVNDLHHMPDRMVMRFPKMGLKDAIAANEAREKPFAPISPNTVRDGYFSVVRWVFGHAVELEAVPMNPCTGIKIRGATKGDGRRTRNPFRADELNALFRLADVSGEQIHDWLDAIANNLRPADFDEIRATNPLLTIGDPDPLLVLTMSVMQSEDAWVITDDGEPISVYGAGPSDDPASGIVWMLGTPGMERPRAKIAIGKETYAVFKRWHQRWPRLFNHVDARNSMSILWLFRAGFEIEEVDLTHGRESRPFYLISSIQEGPIHL